SRLYEPNVRTGTAYAATLSIRLTWSGSSSDDTLGLSATDKKGRSVGDDTLAVSNAGGNMNFFQLDLPRGETYTITAFNQVGNSAEAVPSQAIAKLKVVNLAKSPQPAEPTGGPGFANYHIPLGLMPPTAEEQQLGGRAFGEPSIGVDPRTDDVLYQAGLYTIKGTFGSGRHAKATFTDVSDAPLTTSFSEDAILDTDRFTGRTWVSQL